MRQFFVITGLLLAFLGAPALAQDGPPPHVRAAVRATVDMLRSEGPAGIGGYIDNAMAPGSVGDRGALTARLEALRESTRGRADRVGVEAAPGGVIVELSGASGEARVNLSFGVDGKVTAISAGEAPAPITGADPRRHTQAIEALAEGPLDGGVARFEREHFSAAFMARTTPAERRDLLSRAREAVANAGAVTIQRQGAETVLGLRGQSDTDVVITMEQGAPYGIETMEVRAIARESMNFTPESLPASFDRLAENGFSGTVYVRRNGREVLNRAYGMANAELGAPMTLDTAFGIGSTPIDFTVAAIQLLDQRGMIDTSHRIDRYFPEAPADKRAITIEHLLTGQSGLPDFVHTDADWNPDLAWIDRAEMERRILAAPLRFAPGTSRAHSHAAFGLLAALIERVSGQSYGDFLRANFFEPAGMSRTGFYGETRGLGVRDFAVGPGPSVVGAPNIPPNWGPTSWLVMGSGGMFSTLNDMRRFYELMNGGAVLNRAHAAAFTGQGVGVGGSDQGFYLFHAFNGGDNVALMLSNSDGRTPMMRQIGDGLADLVGIEPRRA